jgi:hypothetical protein
MRVNVMGGTAILGRPSLCLSCRYSTIIQGPSLGDQIVECAQLSPDGARIPFSVTSCSVYVHRAQPSLHEMEEIAWVWRSDPKRRQTGFVRARDLAVRERFVLPDEP